MNTEILKQGGIDYEEGLGRFMNNHMLYEKFLLKFPADENYEKAVKAMADKDYKALLAYTHALKGVSGNLSIMPLFASCTEIVAAIRAEEFDKCEQIFEKINANYDEAKAAIEAAK
jgi:HPt (histidine-containing phosphotransfer) domain-containing protein